MAFSRFLGTVHCPLHILTVVCSLCRIPLVDIYIPKSKSSIYITWRFWRWILMSRTINSLF